MTAIALSGIVVACAPVVGPDPPGSEGFVDQ